MATNDTLRQRKQKEKGGSGWNGSDVSWGESRDGSLNSGNNWGMGSFSGTGGNSFSGQSIASFGGFPLPAYSATASTGPYGNSSQAQSDSRSQNESQFPQPQYKTANEYAQAVQQWLWQYHYWNQMNMYYSSFPFYGMSCWPMPQLSPPQLGTAPGLTNIQVTPAGGQVPPPPVQNNFTRAGSQAQPPPQGPAAGRYQRPVNGQRQGREYRIPLLWKRVLAEFIDFLLLFMVKLAVTILTVEYVGIVDIQKYDLDYLLNQNLDYNAAFAMTSELVAMEVINRIFICIFETLCLRRGVAGTIGGTTPGKRMMGLCVVSCEDVVEFPGRRIRVTPAQDIGFWNALVRSVIKNFSLAFFFPVCFTVFFFQHNRAAYDIIANCIVVEPLRDEWPRGR